jgi:hypothetical protein
MFLKFINQLHQKIYLLKKYRIQYVRLFDFRFHCTFILYFNLPFHKKDFVTLSITIVLTFLALSRFYLVSKRLASFITAPFFFRKLIKVKEIQVEFSLVITLILLGFFFSFFVQEETNLWFLISLSLLTFGFAITKLKWKRCFL